MTICETVDAHFERLRADFRRVRDEAVWGPEGLYGARRVKVILFPYKSLREILGEEGEG